VLAAFPIEMRAIAVTLWGAVGGLAAALGPSAGAFLIQSLGWRSAFYINLPIGLLAFVLGKRLLRESQDVTARVLIALLGRDPRTAGLATFQHVFALFVLCGLLTSAASIGIRTEPMAEVRAVPEARAVTQGERG